jgi:hypothetical protein
VAPGRPFQIAASTVVIGRDSKELVMTTVETQARSTAAEAIENVDENLLQSLAALAGAPEGVAELAFSAFPRGTRLWAITYGLAVEGKDDQLEITEPGRQAIELAAERCPNPYGDVSLGDLTESTRRAIDALAAKRGGLWLREPQAHAVPEAGGPPRAREAGRQFALSALQTAKGATAAFRKRIRRSKTTA